MSFNKVRDGIWIGGMPDDAAELRPFARIALVAPLKPHEQDVPKQFPFGAFCYMPFSDDIQAPSEAERGTALMAASFVLESVRAGHKTIVLCREGKNRSGLVVALALTMLHGCCGATATRIVQAKRPGALYNFYFRELLAGIEKQDVKP